MNVWWYVRTKSVCEEREEAKEVELQEDTNIELMHVLKAFNFASLWRS